MGWQNQRFAQHSRHTRLTLLGWDNKSRDDGKQRIENTDWAVVEKRMTLAKRFWLRGCISEALSTDGDAAEVGFGNEALVRVKVERTAGGQTLTGFSPAQEDEKF